MLIIIIIIIIIIMLLRIIFVINVIERISIHNVLYMDTKKREIRKISSLGDILYIFYTLK